MEDNKKHCRRCHFLMWERILRQASYSNLGKEKERETDPFTINPKVREMIEQKDWDFFIDNEYQGCEMGCYHKVWRNKILPVAYQGASYIEFEDFLDDVYDDVIVKDRNGCIFFLPFIDEKTELEAAEKMRIEIREEQKTKMEMDFKRKEAIENRRIQKWHGVIASLAVIGAILNPGKFLTKALFIIAIILALIGVVFGPKLSKMLKAIINKIKG